MSKLRGVAKTDSDKKKTCGRPANDFFHYELKDFPKGGFRVAVTDDTQYGIIDQHCRNKAGRTKRKCPTGYNWAGTIEKGFYNENNTDPLEHCWFGLKRTVCKRNWNVDALSSDRNISKCCTGEQDLKFCDPKIRGPDCDEHGKPCRNEMNRICNTGKDTTGDYCYKWCIADLNKDNNNCIGFFGNYCKGDKLKSLECKKWCDRNGLQCDMNRKEWCATQSKDEPLCACYQSTDFYKNYRKELQKKIGGLGVQLSSYDPVCSYPDCAASKFKPTISGTPVACPSIINCIQSAEVKGDGTINTDTIEISQEARCGSVTILTKEEEREQEKKIEEEERIEEEEKKKIEDDEEKKKIEEEEDDEDDEVDTNIYIAGIAFTPLSLYLIGGGIFIFLIIIIIIVAMSGGRR